MSAAVPNRLLQGDHLHPNNFTSINHHGRGFNTGQHGIYHLFYTIKERNVVILTTLYIYASVLP